MSLVDVPGRSTVSMFDDASSADGLSLPTISQRKAVEGLENPCPLARLLPSMFYEDSFAMRLCAGLDEILAPILSTLDCLDDYFDPSVTPYDFLDWLARWVGLTLNQNWPESRQRALLRAASELYRWEGTAHGIRGYVRLVTGTVPDVVDNGGVVWSSEPGGDLPGSSVDQLVVRLQVLPGAPAVDVAQVEAVVAATKPAHMPHRIELVAGRAERAGEPAGTSPAAGTDEAGDRLVGGGVGDAGEIGGDLTDQGPGTRGEMDENLGLAGEMNSDGADENGLSTEDDGSLGTGVEGGSCGRDGPSSEIE
ncbi:MAG TPA: phage tail protein [Acidimicrobiales bacterium]|nr:phage tail protein [Acidimicrobiales bacterium]